MDFGNLFQMGAEMIRSNSDESTTALDMGSISSALGNLLQDSDGGLDISSLVSGLSSNGLGDIVNSWLGNGENSSIDAGQISQLLGSDKISAFAQQLGLSGESASQALADALPNIIDKATSGESGIVEQMLSGKSNPMDMLGKMFG